MTISWTKALLSVGLFALWFCGLIIVGGWGYPSQYFWTSGCAVAIIFSAAPFWRYRAEIWYWLTVASLAVANVAALYMLRSQVSVSELPAKGLVEIYFLIDCMMSWAAIVGVYWLGNHRFPWQIPDA